MIRYRCQFLLLIIVSVITSCEGLKRNAGNAKNNDIVVAAYYFPNYHTGDARHARNPDKGPAWSEWELVKNAIPRFPGHQQPLKPLWGYRDEKQPEVMEQNITAATGHGINCFIFDWYMYEDGPFLNRCIDEGFLKAKNVNAMSFALMWANHDWKDIHPLRKGDKPEVLYPGKVSPGRFEEIADLLIRQYFLKKNYLKIDGKPYFSIYDVSKFIESFGSVTLARAAMDRMDKKAMQAGLKGVHWNLVAWGRPILPGEEVPADIPSLIRGLKFNSVTSYVWIHHVPLPRTQTDYNHVKNRYFEYWTKADSTYPAPYFPNVTMGWDPSPRCHPDSKWDASGYPYMNTISNNTPENFKIALQATKDRMLKQPGGFKMMTINCWNEWTEGSYLEPDTKNGMQYLEAVKDVFGK